MKVGSKPLSTKAIQIAPELERVQSLMPMSEADQAALKASIQKYGIKDVLCGYCKGNQFYLLSDLNRLHILTGVPFIY